MKCKIIFERDPKTLKVTDKIKAVKAPNGQKSILFDDIRNQVVDDKLSLETYYKTYTDEFKDKVKGVGKDKNDEVIFEEVKDIILPSRMLASVGDGLYSSSDVKPGVGEFFNLFETLNNVDDIINYLIKNKIVSKKCN